MAMMNVGRGTQNYSSAPQESSLRSDSTQRLSSTDAEKYLGDQSVGEVLNKISDPNWVDPSKKLRAVGNNQLDKDAFLKLMLAQMKHQDPTNPMQSHEMAAQLAQFTSLEQLNNINTTLESMRHSQTPAINYQALGFIGKKVSGDSSRISRLAGDSEHVLNFELLSDTAATSVVIKDAEGNSVRKLDFGSLRKGANSVKWNGLLEDGTSARPGEYRVAVEAKGPNDSKVHVKTQFEGRITGINYASDGPVLLVNGQNVRLSDVKKIEEASLEGVSLPATAIPLDGQDKNSKAAESGSNAVNAAETSTSGGGNLDSVPMSRELLNKLSKLK